MNERMSEWGSGWVSYWAIEWVSDWVIERLSDSMIQWLRSWDHHKRRTRVELELIDTHTHTHKYKFIHFIARRLAMNRGTSLKAPTFATKKTTVNWRMIWSARSERKYVQSFLHTSFINRPLFRFFFLSGTLKVFFFHTTSIEHSLSMKNSKKKLKKTETTSFLLKDQQKQNLLRMVPDPVTKLSSSLSSSHFFVK